MTDIIAQLQFSATITGPICLMLGLGVLFKRINLINENFIEVASRIVFQVTLPAMLFLSIVSSKHDFSSSTSLVVYSLIANMLFFLFTLFSTRKLIDRPHDWGVITQGGFRANTAIIGLAYVANTYGNAGVALAAIYVASTTVLFNIQAVIALTPRGESNGWQAGKLMFKTLTKNPLIISIVLGFLCYLASVPIPKIVTDAGHYFANMTLPLALLCTGGSLNLNSLKDDRHSAWFAIGYKLILSPLLITLWRLATWLSRLRSRPTLFDDLRAHRGSQLCDGKSHGWKCDTGCQYYRPDHRVFTLYLYAWYFPAF